MNTSIINAFKHCFQKLWHSHFRSCKMARTRRVSRIFWRPRAIFLFLNQHRINWNRFISCQRNNTVWHFLHSRWTSRNDGIWMRFHVPTSSGGHGNGKMSTLQPSFNEIQWNYNRLSFTGNMSTFEIFDIHSFSFSLLVANTKKFLRTPVRHFDPPPTPRETSPPIDD